MKKALKHMLNNVGTLDELKLKKSIEKYDVISFDIFDTLIKRDVPEPKDVFRLIEHNYNIVGYANQRVKAEIEARCCSDKEDVSLWEIYDYYEGKEDIERLVTFEKETELSICIRNEPIYNIYQYCIEKGKQIVLISDMYLDRKTIVNILEKAGYIDYSHLYISNCEGYTKASGKLFKYVLSDLKIQSDQIIHIGNSFKGDYICAEKKGIKTIKIPTEFYCGSFPTKNRTYEERMFSAFLSNHSALLGEDYYVHFGYECLGPMLYSFTNWLLQKAKAENIERLFFLARDGYILKQAYEAQGYDKIIPAYYFEASRQSMRMPYISLSNDVRDIIGELGIPMFTTFKEIFNVLGIEEDIGIETMNAYGYDCSKTYKWNQLSSEESFQNALRFFLPQIKEKAQKEREAFEKYISSFEMNGRSGIVDIGWRGSMLKYLKICLEGMSIKADLTGYFLGISNEAKEIWSSNNLKGYGFLFDCVNNDTDMSDNRAYAGLIESFFLEHKGTVKKYHLSHDTVTIERGEYEYSKKPEVESYISAIQKSAVRFIEDYVNSLVNVEVNNKDIYVGRIMRMLKNPSMQDVKAFGRFPFINNGMELELAHPKHLTNYIRNPKQLLKDFGDSKWKMGFLRALFKLPFPFYQLFRGGLRLDYKKRNL